MLSSGTAVVLVMFIGKSVVEWVEGDGEAETATDSSPEKTTSRPHSTRMKTVTLGDSMALWTCSYTQ